MAIDVSQDHENEAWEAYMLARRDWVQRHAPSPGARAGAILRNLLYPPSYILGCEEALKLYLGDEQRSERPGVYRGRSKLGKRAWTP